LGYEVRAPQRRADHAFTKVSGLGRRCFACRRRFRLFRRQRSGRADLRFVDIESAGRLSIRLTDSPFSDAQALLVTFSEVSVHRADPGEWKTIPFVTGSSRTCDLKQLKDAIDLLGVGSLPAGKYTQIRLNVTSAALYFDNASATGPCAAQIAAPAGESAPVDIPSGEVKLNNEFTVAGSGTTITLDFDGDQSVLQTGSGNSNGNGNGRGGTNSSKKYMMVPVIRVVSVQ
jgi:hypothetical protein